MGVNEALHGNFDGSSSAYIVEDLEESNSATNVDFKKK